MSPRVVQQPRLGVVDELCVSSSDAWALLPRGGPRGVARDSGERNACAESREISPHSRRRGMRGIGMGELRLVAMAPFIVPLWSKRPPEGEGVCELVFVYC